MPQPEPIYCRMAPSLGALEDTPENIWGTPEYEGDLDSPTVFFGLYGFPDFYTLWRHRGRRWLLWAGSDITHFKNGYWLDDSATGPKLSPEVLASWISTHCENYVENEVERSALEALGIKAKVVPSFLGRINDFDISYQWSAKPKLYTSVSGDNFELYGWHRIPQLAKDNPGIEFHLYGNELRGADMPPNVFDHGRVPKEQMNQEIAGMQGALRLTEFDGFSEILAKSVLMGQWPVSLIPYEHMLGVEEIGSLAERQQPNFDGRDHYAYKLNNFPWVN